MSQAHIEQFYAIAAKDEALLARMMAGTNGPDDFVANAVKEGKALGYTFTAEEGSAWIKKQQDIKASGELSDSQLEAVAGGKTARQALGNVGGALDKAWNALPTDRQVINWFRSW